MGGKGERRRADGGGGGRRRLTAAAVTVGVLGAAVTGVVVSQGGGGAPAAQKTSGAVRTVAVSRADMANASSLQGTLGYADERPVAGVEGRVTWLPASGAVVSRGEQLFRVDDQPVSLFYGGTPLFRRLDTPGVVGRDVKVIADNLLALGYDIGSQPPVGTSVTQPAGATAPTDPPGATPAVDPGTTVSGPSGPPAVTPSPRAARVKVKVREGDAVLTRPLMSAVRRWQGAAGMVQSGVLGTGDVVVLPFEVRVTGITAALGSDAGAPLLTAASTRKVVTVQVRPLEAETIRSADTVTVTLPDGAPTKGTVSAIGRVAATDADGSAPGAGSDPTLTATVRIDNSAAVRDLDAAPVQVEFTGKVKRDVLVVPVGALLALTEGGYGVQPATGGLVPVTVGLFVKGMVEISGSGITEGTKVVTTS